MRYASELYSRERAEESYRYYVTDVLKALVGANERYYDRIHPPEDIDVEATIDGVVSRAGLEVIE